MREVKKLEDTYIVNDDTYFADNMYVTNSMLKQLMTGSTMRLDHYLNMEHKETESLIVGSAFHCYILEPEEFESRYVFAPKFDKRTKVGKAMYAEFEETLDGRKPVPGHYEFAFERMHENIYSNINAAHLMNEAKGRETIHFWEDVETGLKCKGKVDAEGEDYLVDLKTTSKGADHESFNKFVNDYKITQQAAFYLNGTKKKDFYFIMVELKAPFGVGIYKMSEQAIEFGNKQVESTIKIYKEYISNELVTDLNGGNIVIV